MENTKKLSSSESLDIITKTIAQTRENIKGQSFYYILWGWITASASLSHYALNTFTNFKFSYLPWLILIPIGWFASAIHSMQVGSTKAYETYLEVFLKYLWVVIGISFMPIVYISIESNTDPASFVLLLAGVGTLVSGLTMKFKPLSVGGVSFFFFSIASLFVSSSDTLLLTCLAIIVGYLIPAYILKRSN